MDSGPSVWVDERHAVLRRGIVACLTNDHCVVVGESAGLRPRPDLSEVDVLIVEASPRTVAFSQDPGWPPRVSVAATFSMPADDCVRRLAQAGVSTFLDRDEITPESLAGGVRGVLTDVVSVPVAAFSELIGSAGASHVAHPLMPREREVLRLLADGLDTRTISGTLSYSERTVKNIVHDVFVKLDCRTRAQAVGVATRHGLI